MISWCIFPQLFVWQIAFTLILRYEPSQPQILLVSNPFISLWLTVYILTDWFVTMLLRNLLFYSWRMVVIGLFMSDFLNFTTALILASWNFNKLQSVSFSSIFWKVFYRIGAIFLIFCLEITRETTWTCKYFWKIFWVMDSVSLIIAKLIILFI